MKTEENCLILENGDTLYRYDLEGNLPQTWDPNYHSIEYSGSIHGFKNAIGAVFLFDKRITAKQILSGAINNQRIKGNKPEQATITSVIVNDEIKLLDLSSGIITCTNLIAVLHNIGLDVTTMDLTNYQRQESFTSIHDKVIDLYSYDQSIKRKAIKEIDNFFFGMVNLLGQSLTDFQNGVLFKRLLEEHHYEGYVFSENPSSDTYCIFSPDKLSQPHHDQIVIEEDEELNLYLKQDFDGRPQNQQDQISRTLSDTQNP